MKKKDFLKLALIGLASGACIASQNATSDDLDLNNLLAMTKCTKDQKNNRDMDRNGNQDMDRSSCGNGSCGSCNGNDESCDNGRKATRDEIFGRDNQKDQEMDQKRCGKFY